jgi:Ca2+-binding EF-hand superfamily protein
MLSPAQGLLLALLVALPGATQKHGGKQQKPAPAGRDSKPAEPPPPEEDVAKKYFELADYDGNHWITISEARSALGIDRKGFAIYDIDADGRISLDEFRRRYDTIVKNGGAFDPPIGKGGQRTRGAADPTERALHFDIDGDGALERSELRAFLEDLRSRLETDIVMPKFDRDGNRKLEKEELTALLAFLDPARRSQPTPHAASIEELFGKSYPRQERNDAMQLAPRMPGPVPAFRRLDLDGNGRISADELRSLQRPIQVPVRLAAVLATLDTNGDDAIDEAEFAASMAVK